MIRKQPGTEQSLTRAVAEATTRDAGRNIARLDPADMAALGVRAGDTIEVRGERATVCKVMPAMPDDRGRSIVRIDGLMRTNARAAIDQDVRVAPTACAPAQRITIEPIGFRPQQRDLEYIATRLDGLALIEGDRIRVGLIGNRRAEFTVKRVTPSGAVLVDEETTLELAGGAKPRGKAGSKQADTTGGAPASVSYEDVGGLGSQVRRIRETIELPLRFPEVFERLGIDPPTGVLLQGPPGTGKTLIARAIAHETNASFYVISGPEIVHKHYGESESNLRKVWAEAQKNSPSIIFIDEIDSIAPKRENTQGEVEKRIVAQLLALMDGLSASDGVMVLAATNLPDSLDPALRRPGRFDREIEIPVPDAQGRREVLDIHTRGMPLAGDCDLDHLAQVTHGCVGADLASLCREAALRCLRRVAGEIDFEKGELPYETLAKLTVSGEDFVNALGEITPSAMREVFIEPPNGRWDDIGGLEDVKRTLVEAVDWPLRHADLFRRTNLRAPKGVMLAGPPGVGKTLIAKATANELGANFISVKGPELLSKFVGESERGLRDIFRKARQASPCVIFMDEIDAMLPIRSGGGGSDAGVRERVAAQFLAEMDGIEELRGVLVLGATNRVDMIDPAVLRPGRFDRVIELTTPSDQDRARIFEVHLRGRPIEEGVTAGELAKQAVDASGAEVAGICERAAMLAVRDAIDAGTERPVITRAHFAKATTQLLAEHNR